MLFTYLAVTLALLVLLGITASSVFVQHYISERKQELTREGSEISTVISEKYLYEEKRNVALDELLTIARKYDGLIQLKFNDEHYGRVYVLNNADGSSDKWSLIADYFSYMNVFSFDGTDKQITKKDVFSPITDMRTMTLVTPIKRDIDTVGMLCFTVDMTPTYSVIESVVIDVVIFSTMGIILAFLAVLYITERITRPVSAITKTVRRFSKGEYDARIAYKSDDELGELAASFNKMADEVNTLETARRSFVANVSHELRSPLASMRGFLVAMQDGTIPPESYGKYLGIVIDENKRMTEMVNELLDMARIESGGEQALSLEVFDITEVIRTTVITFEARINEKHINVDMQLGNEQIFVHADKGQIAHVLRNLIDNAIKFTPEGGMLSLHVLEKKQIIWVSIKDSGPGIAEADMPHIFDRFYKAEKAHTRSSGSGTGLGLAIAKRIIDAHEQSIYVTNDNGACFMFSLKRVPRPKRPQRAATQYRHYTRKPRNTQAENVVQQKSASEKLTADTAPVAETVTEEKQENTRALVVFTDPQASVSPTSNDSDNSIDTEPYENKQTEANNTNYTEN